MTDRAAIIRQRVPLRELVEETVELRRKGRELSGPCPFHADSHPSLNVNEEKGVWVCRACSTGGTVFDWVMHRDGLDFKGAMKLLAHRAGLGDEPLSRRERQAIEQKRQAVEAEKQESKRVQEAIMRGYDLIRTGRGEIRRLRLLASGTGDREMRGPVWEALSAQYKRAETIRLWVDQHDGFANEFAGEDY